MQYVNAVRLSIYAAKALKDIQHNLKDFESSANDVLHQQHIKLSLDWAEFDNFFSDLLNAKDNSKFLLQIENGFTIAKRQEEEKNLDIIAKLKLNLLTEVEASTMMNVSYELLSCKHSLLTALKIIESEANHNKANTLHSSSI